MQSAPLLFHTELIELMAIVQGAVQLLYWLRCRDLHLNPANQLCEWNSHEHLYLWRFKVWLGYDKAFDLCVFFLPYHIYRMLL